MPSPDQKPQLEKFKELARDLEVDEDEKHWDDRLRKLAKVRPALAPSETPEGGKP